MGLAGAVGVSMSGSGWFSLDVFKIKHVSNHKD